MSDQTLGFIITRYVTDELTANYWINAYKCIRQFYPLNKICIIDGGSNYDYIKLSDNMQFINYEIIKTDYPKGAMFSPYYYYFKYKWFDKAVILHDSVFINTYISFDEITTVRTIWHFDDHRWDNYSYDTAIINLLSNNVELLKLYHTKSDWDGCFGCMSVITHSFLDYLNSKYNLINLIIHLNNHNWQVALERVFGVIFTLEEPTLNITKSILGKHDAILSPSYSYKEYMIDRQHQLFNDKNKYRMIKVYTIRHKSI